MPSTKCIFQYRWENHNFKGAEIFTIETTRVRPPRPLQSLTPGLITYDFARFELDIKLYEDWNKLTAFTASSSRIQRSLLTKRRHKFNMFFLHVYSIIVTSCILMHNYRQRRRYVEGNHISYLQNRARGNKSKKWYRGLAYE